MLYWGIFTTGYIVGVMFTLYIFIRKKPINNSTGQENIDKIAQNMVQKPSKIFARLTQINYLSKKKGYSFIASDLLEDLGKINKLRTIKKRKR